jgi:hypothetical protein
MSDVKYTPEAEPGKTCAECKFFDPNEDDPASGKCYGYVVEAKGGCNMFAPKE